MSVSSKNTGRICPIKLDMSYKAEHGHALLHKEYFSTYRFRSSRSEVFCKKGVLRNFAKFAGKHLCQSLFFNKVAGLRPATLFKKRLWRRCFPANFAKFLRTPFLQKTSEQLLLPIFYDVFYQVKTYTVLNQC